MRITPLTLEDCGPVAQLHQALFLRGWNQKDFEDFVNDPLVFGLTIQENKDILGYVVWREVKEEAEIFTIVVRPHFQGKGLGTRLLNHLCNQLHTHRIKNLFLEVAADNVKAQSFYIRHGFVCQGKRPGYYKRQGDALVDAWVFSKTIEGY